MGSLLRSNIGEEMIALFSFEGTGKFTQKRGPIAQLVRAHA